MNPAALAALRSLFNGEAHRFHAGMQSADPRDFFSPRTGALHDAILAERCRWIMDHPERTLAIQPEAWPLLEETLERIREWGVVDGALLQTLNECRTVEEKLRALALGWEPDFLLMRLTPDGEPVLSGGAVCFPSSWAFEEKMGHPMSVIHQPVPGLNDALSVAISRLLKSLKPGPAWLRANWGLSASPESNQHPLRRLPRLTAETGLESIWVRIERQALVALPRSGGVLFAIHVDIHPLGFVCADPALRHGLVCALESLPEPLARYKGVSEVREPLLRRLRTNEAGQG